MRKRLDRANLLRYLQRQITTAAENGLERVDANESLAFARELEHFVGQVYDLELVELKALSFFAADPAADPADRSYTTRQMTSSGSVAHVTDWTTELPTVAYSAKGENNYPIKLFANQYAFTIDDLRVAARTGRPLEPKLAEVAKRAHAENFEQLVWFGDDESGVKGIFDSAEIVSNGTAKVGVAWDTAPATLVDIVLNDFGNMWKKICVDTSYLYMPDTWILPTEQYAIIHEPRSLGTGNGFDSIANLIMRSYGPQGLREIATTHKLNTGTTGAAGGAPRNVLYKKHPDVIAHQTPVFFEQILPQAQGLGIRVPCMSKLGGAHSEKPKGVTFMDGATT